MNEFYDVYQLLKRFGVIIYTGNRNQDIIAMEQEVKELFDHQFIDQQTYLQSVLVLRKEMSVDQTP
ncbi:YqgQ family protein [Sporosarcina obsidiansis]|uniref:YqgQ family protein n=1 Tax=Sporosarcina obsidiansis TaxID=2660748 RepID=UPI00129AF39D|nr:YqgQ family protein [Sporosarcina obsidiansis]